MTKQDILNQLKSAQKKLGPYHIKSMALFGSVARGEATLNSDVDVMVEFEGPSTFNNLMQVRFILEDLLGAHVDLITRKGIRSEILPTIDKEAIYVT